MDAPSRRSRAVALAATLLALCLAVSPALAQTVGVLVPGGANPYLAGMPDGSACCAGDSAPFQSPVPVNGLPIPPGAALTFTVTGSVSNDSGKPPADPPDGSDFFSVVPGVNGTPSNNGIAAINAPVNALVGVFLDGGAPNASPAPSGLDFSDAGLGRGFPILCPALKQVFFIGDGRTGGGSGQVQQFLVPPGATRFFLGTVDGFGWFTNSGQFSVQVTSSTAVASPPPAGPLSAAVLPASRSVQVGATATAFATIVNAGGAPAVGCGISPITQVPAGFGYQTTSAATNALIGNAGTPVCIAPGAAQSYVFALTPSAAFGPTDVALNFSCANAGSAATIAGLNTLLMVASDTPVPDVIALSATPSQDGIVNVTSGSGFFVVATSNIGAAANITVSADTGSAVLPISMAVCQTDAASVCLAPPAASVTVNMANGATPTFAVFVAAGGNVPFDPAVNRILVRFRDDGGVSRGATTVAVRTQ